MQKNTIILFITAIAALVLVSGCQTTGTGTRYGQPQKAAYKRQPAGQREMANGRSYYRNKMYPKAEESLKQALRLGLSSGEREEANIMLGYISERNGKPGEAIRYFERAGTPQAKSAILKLTKSLVEKAKGRGDSQEAMKYLRVYQKHSGTNAYSLLEASRITASGKDYIQALEYARRAHKKKPSKATQAQLSSLLPKAAEQAFGEKRNPLVMELTQELLAGYKLSQRQESRYRFMRGSVLSQGGEKAKALTELEKATTLDSQNAEAWGLMGDIAASKGELELARQYYGKAADANPKGPFGQKLAESSYELVKKLYMGKQYGKVCQEGPKTASLDSLSSGQRSSLWLMVGNSQKLTGKPDGAVAESFQRAVSESPDSAEANFHLGKLLVSTPFSDIRDCRKGLGYINKALELDPGNQNMAHAFFVGVKCLYGILGSYQEKEDFLHWVLGTGYLEGNKQALAEVHENLAVVYFEQREKWALAKKEAQKAIQLDLTKKIAKQIWAYITSVAEEPQLRQNALEAVKLMEGVVNEPGAVAEDWEILALAYHETKDDRDIDALNKAFEVLEKENRKGPGSRSLRDTLYELRELFEQSWKPYRK